MSLEMDFQVEKLSEPIEELALNQRAYHMLRRANIHTVKDIILRGESNILSIRNLGPLLLNHIFLQVAKFLGVSKERLFEEDVREISALQQEEAFNPLNTSVGVLNLPPVLLNSFRKAGITRIKDLIASSNNQYSNIVKIGRRAIREIDRALLLYLTSDRDSASASDNLPIKSDTVLPNAEVLIKDEKTDIADVLVINKTENLGQIFNWLGINERSWLAVELRASRLLTFEEISAEIGGITRARAHQIIDQVIYKINTNLNSFSLFFDYFEKKSMGIRKKLSKEHNEMNALVNELRTGMSDTNLSATNEELVRLINIVRILVMQRKPWTWDEIEARWKKTIFLCCLVDPPIEKNEKIKQFVEKRERKKRELSYKELAHLVLINAKKPLHWSEIAKQAYSLSKRKSFDTNGIYHALLDHDDFFVRVGQGTYELVEWGSKQVESYPDIIASILLRENRDIPFEVILARVSSIRSVKQPSLAMYLDMHPRFYKSINDTYGLRGWLPPREKQNLRTPEWLIEDSRSLERVERAKQRGYEVESIITDDKLQ